MLTLVIAFHVMTLGVFAADTFVLEKIAWTLASAMADASAGEGLPVYIWSRDIDHTSGAVDTFAYQNCDLYLYAPNGEQMDSLQGMSSTEMIYRTGKAERDTISYSSTNQHKRTVCLGSRQQKTGSLTQA